MQPATHSISRIRFLLCLLASLPFWSPPAHSCCALSRPGEPVVNADQTVLLIWDPATKTEHFIRQASFLAEGDDFGFLVPTPTRPELSESGQAVFPALAQITRPPAPSGGLSFGCSAPSATRSGPQAVTVIERKEVAGFDAAVLSASSPTALTGWLKKNGYSYSPEVEAWAGPYIRDGWMLTALRVAKKQRGTAKAAVSAAALRISFHTERPLFPYREPDSRRAAASLAAPSRLLRLYFISDTRYDGALESTSGWSGQPVWSNALTAAQKANLLALLKLPSTATPARWWLTEFEDRWPYAVAPGDLYFHPARRPSPLARGDLAAPTHDISLLLLVTLGLATLARKRKRQESPRELAGHPAW